MGSEMCIRDRCRGNGPAPGHERDGLDVGVHDESDQDSHGQLHVCLLYTSDAADERSSVDLGGRRIIKQKKE